MTGPAVRLHAGAVGSVIDCLEAAFAAATSLAFRRSSTTRGRQPDWLREATRFGLAGVTRDGGEAAVVRLRVPRLGEAAKALYRQPSLFGDDLPDEDATGLDVLGDIIHEVRDRDGGNDEVDLNMLRRLRLFGPSLDRGIGTVELEVRDQAKVDRDLVQISKELSDQTPGSRRVRVTGRLDMLCDSDNLFRLVLPDGEVVRGIWMPGEIPNLGPMLRQEVTVDGVAAFRPSGQLLRVDAEAMVPAREQDAFFAEVPRPEWPKLRPEDWRRPQTPQRNMRNVMGQWPGDESDEEIIRALEEMS